MSKDNTAANKRSKRNVRKPLRYATSPDETTPRKRFKSHRKVTDKNSNIEDDIIELGHIMDEESNCSTEYTSDSDDITNEHLSQRKEKIASTQSPQNIPNPTLQNVPHATPQNIPHPVLHNVPHQTSQNVLHPISPLPSSSTVMSHRQENTYMQYDQNVNFCPQQTINVPPPSSPSTSLSTDIRFSLQPIYYNKLSERFDNLDKQMRQLCHVVQNALKDNKNLKRPPTKPIVLPITSIEQMEAFDHVEEDIYLSVVRYFEFLGGFHIKEVVSTQ